MTNKWRGILKRAVSSLTALALLAGNLLPAMPLTASAAGTAHTINVFDIHIKQGADYYTSYVPDDPLQPGAPLENVYVWQADNANEGHKFVYNIKFSVSGEGTTDIVNPTDKEKQAIEAVSEGFIQIRIPAHILKYKGDTSILPDTQGLYPDEAEMPVPNITQMSYKEIGGQKVYDTDHQFVYRYEDNGTPADEADDYFVIYNIKPVSAGVVYEFPVAYQMSKNTWEYQDLGASAPCQASVTVKSWEMEGDVTQKVPITQTSRAVPVYIDTNARITGTVKRADSTTLLTAEAAAGKFGCGALDSNYRYIIWSVSSDISDVTQKYDLALVDTPGVLTGTDADGVTHTVNGQFVAAKMDGQITQQLTGLTGSGKRTDYVLTRYRYTASDTEEGIASIESAPKNGVYSANNQVRMTLTPADGQDDRSVADSSAPFKLELKNPAWTPIEEKYTANKWGLYHDGMQRVGSKAHITSYELANLLSDTEVSGIEYETFVTAHAYGKTIASLNDEITSMVVPAAIDSNDMADITAGSRIYHFDTAARTCTCSVYDSALHETCLSTYQVAVPADAELTLLNLQRIAAQDIADHYYGQRYLEYRFEDKTFRITDKDVSAEATDLDQKDYRIDSFSYTYTVKSSVYDPAAMEFSAGEANQNLSADDDHNNILAFYVYHDGSNTAQLGGTYNIRTDEAVITDPSLISSITKDSVVFSDTANVTGYLIQTINQYFYIELSTRPRVTLKPSTKVKAIVEPLINGTTSEKKIALQNTANWTVRHEDGTELLNTDRVGTDYIADIVRTSTISKKAFGEKNAVTGQDGQIYRSHNDTLKSEYDLVWQTRIAETADGIEVDGKIRNNVPVPQESGIFYDLLPSHSDIIEGSVNVYVDAAGDVNQNTAALPPSAFEVLDRVDNYHGSGKKLLIVKIHAPCSVSYTVTYTTVHSHEDIQDYGSYVLNTVAYQTGNPNIGDGYADDGGNYAVSMSNYMTGLDPNNGAAKRFIYAEATEDILALFPTSSGIYKKVATRSDPTYKKSGVVHNGETYTYHIRMKNDSSTKARDIAILDSVENYRTVGGVRYNSGLSYDRDWNGTIVSFDLQGIENKIAAYAAANPASHTTVQDLKLIVYTGDAIVDLGSETYSDSEARKELLVNILAGNTTGDAAGWHVVDNWKDPKNVDLSKVTAFIVYTGPHFVLAKNDSMSFTLLMQAPDEVVVEGTADPANGVFLTQPKTYNNIYRSFTTIPEEKADDESTDVTYFYTHYDYTQVQYNTAGTLRFLKADAKTGEGIPDIQFNLSGLSDYGTAYNETLVSDSTGYVEFRNLERGTYQLIESVSDADHQLDTTPRTVTVDPRGAVTIVTVDGVVIQDGAGNYTIQNQPRYHGELAFTKVDSLSGKGISGTVFTLSGTSDYNTPYNAVEAVSDGSGSVSFGDIEKGTYTLTETQPSKGYLPPAVNTYQVTCSGTEDLIFRITGENAANTAEGILIKNAPTAELNLQKVDSITKETLDDAQFTLTANGSLHSTLANLTSKVSDTAWTQSGGSWVQTVSGGTSGRYIFTYLPEGTYTLKETKAPAHYAENTQEYTIKVVKSADGKRLVIELPEGKPEWEYIRIENGEFVPATADTAAYQRLNNTEVYEDGKTVVKSWVGDVDGSFPVMHLSNEKPEADIVKVTINENLYTIIHNWNHESRLLGLKKADSLAQAPPWALNADGTIKQNTNLSYDCTTYGIDGEEGHFYAWWGVVSTNSGSNAYLYWYSDADIIYLPTNCRSLFSGCNNVAFTEIDLSESKTGKVFSAEKTTNMYQMFNGCSNLQTIDLSCIIDTPSLTTTREMFQNCTEANSIDLSNWRNAQSLTVMQSMYFNCQKLKSVDLSNLVISNLENCQQMFRDCFILENVIFGNHITLNEYKTSNNSSGYGLMSMFINAGKDGTGMTIDLSGLDTRSIINGTIKDSNNKVVGSPWGIGHMFSGCSKLTTIYVSDYWDNTNFSTERNDWSQNNAFNSCTSLVGGSGTTYSNNTNLNSYAKVDGGPSDPGYFTYKAAPTPIDISSGSSGSSTTISNVDFNDYPNFTKTGSVTQATNTTATAEDAGKTSFTFEYVTAKTSVPTSGTEPYEVNETVYMTVSQIVEDNGTYYTVSQKYKYDGTVKAKWTEVGGTAPTQWKCEMQVFNADEEFFAWEDKVAGYVSTADKTAPVKTVGSADKPVITNSKDPIGSLALSKKLKGTDSEKFSGDTFWFKVTMKNEDQSAYTMLPFDASGVAYFEVHPNADDPVLISGIPAGCTYMVEEIDETGHPMPSGYSKTAESGTSGTITANTVVTAEITNRIETVNLTLKKQTSLWKTTDKTTPPTEITDVSDSDYAAWANEDFTFTVLFRNLVKGQAYSYTIDGSPKYVVVNGSKVEDKIVGNDKSEITEKEITVKAGQTVVFLDLPTYTKYTVTETAQHEDSVSSTYSETYETAYSITGANPANGDGYTVPEQTLLADGDTVTFTNKKTVDVSHLPETVTVTVNKEWYNAAGTQVLWTTDSNGNLIAPEGNYPSFLKVYLGRALKVGDGDGAVYVDIEPGFTSYSLKAKESWSYTFEDLPKTGEITMGSVTTAYPYVYFVTEVVPVGFHNSNAVSEYTKISTEQYFVAAGSGNAYTFTLKNQEDITHSLSVCKLVTGNMGNKSKDFEFEIAFRNSAGKALSGTGFTIRFTDLYDSTYERKRTYTLEDGTIHISLPHGKKVEFLSLPEGTRYTITEITDGAYTTHVGVYTGDPKTVDASGFAETVSCAGTLTADTNYLYVNDLTANIPTGISLNVTAAPIVFVLISGSILLLLILRRREKSRYHE